MNIPSRGGRTPREHPGVADVAALQCASAKAFLDLEASLPDNPPAAPSDAGAPPLKVEDVMCECGHDADDHCELGCLVCTETIGCTKTALGVVLAALTTTRSALEESDRRRQDITDAHEAVKRSWEGLMVGNRQLSDSVATLTSEIERLRGALGLTLTGGAISGPTGDMER